MSTTRLAELQALTRAAGSVLHVTNGTFPSADLDLRRVRYFTVVAAHGHFGRAAESLHITQPALSRHIQKLEDALEVRLLDRGPRETRLTEAGAAFLPQAKMVLKSAHAAVAVARQSAGLSVTIGYLGGLIITPAVTQLREAHPECEVRTRHLDWEDAASALPERRVDALLTRLPLRFADHGLRVTVLYDERRVLLVPKRHPLAARASVTLADFAAEPLVRFLEPESDWSTFWRLEPRPDGSSAPEGPTVETVEDRNEVVAGGQALAVMPAGDRRSAMRDDLTTVPIDGVEPCEVVVVTRRSEHSAIVQAFVESAQRTLLNAAS